MSIEERVPAPESAPEVALPPQAPAAAETEEQPPAIEP